MTCQYIFTRGKRKGERCSTTPRKGVYCAQHSSSAQVVSVAIKQDSKQASIISLFEELNTKWLEGAYTLIWRNSKRKFGTCNPTQQIITLSSYLLELHGVDVILGTVRHEIAHACDFKYDQKRGHGASWKKWAIKLGTTPKACTRLEVADPNAKYALRHTVTGEVYRNYYRKPKRFGLLKGSFIPSNKLHTLNKLEIIAL